MLDLLIRNATVVDGQTIGSGSLGIQDGRIAARFGDHGVHARAMMIDPLTADLFDDPVAGAVEQVEEGKAARMAFLRFETVLQAHLVIVQRTDIDLDGVDEDRGPVGKIEERRRVGGIAETETPSLDAA